MAGVQRGTMFQRLASYFCCQVVTARDPGTGDMQIFLNGRKAKHAVAAKVPLMAGRWGLLGWVDEILVLSDGRFDTYDGRVTTERHYGFVKYEMWSDER